MKNTTASSHDMDQDSVIETVPFKGLIRYEQLSPIRQVSYYLCGDILEPQYYTELFYTLRTAAETDLIYLHLNSSGGDFNTGLQIINNILAAMEKARASRMVTTRASEARILLMICRPVLKSPPEQFRCR